MNWCTCYFFTRLDTGFAHHQVKLQCIGLNELQHCQFKMYHYQRPVQAYQIIIKCAWIYSAIATQKSICRRCSWPNLRCIDFIIINSLYRSHLNEMHVATHSQAGRQAGCQQEFHCDIIVHAVRFYIFTILPIVQYARAHWIALNLYESMRIASCLNT